MDTLNKRDVNGLLNKVYLWIFVICVSVSIINTESYMPFVIGKSCNIITLLVYLISCIILLYKIIKDINFNYIHLFIVTIVLLLSFFIGIRSHQSTFPITIELIIAAKGVSFLKICKYFFRTVLFLLILIITLCFLHVLPNIQMYDGIYAHTIRNSYGFNYPLALSSIVLSLCIVLCVINYKKISLIDIILVIIASYISYDLSIARMNYYCSIFLIIIMVIWKYKRKILSVFPFSLSWLSLIIVAIMSILIDVLYDPTNNFYYNFNKLLQNRLYYCSIAINKYPIKIFGNYIKENSNFQTISGTWHNSLPYFYIDQSMLRLLLLNGLLAFVIIIFIYSFKMFKLHTNNLDFIVALFLIIVIWGFSDSKFFEFWYDPFLLILFSNLDAFKDRFS